MRVMDRLRSRIGFCEEMVLENFVYPGARLSLYPQPLTYWVHELRVAEQRVADYVIEMMGAAP